MQFLVTLTFFCLCLLDAYTCPIFTQGTPAHKRGCSPLNKLGNSELDHDFHFAEMILPNVIHYVMPLKVRSKKYVTLGRFMHLILFIGVFHSACNCQLITWPSELNGST